MRVLLIRHGETEWNSAGRLQGQTDIPLSEKGRGEVAARAGEVAAFAPGFVVTSALVRTQQTAAALGLAVDVHDARLNEWNLGSWEGQLKDVVKAEQPEAFRLWRDGDGTPGDGESVADFTSRIVAAFTDAVQGAASASAETCVIIAHGGVVRTLLRALVGLEPAEQTPPAPGSISLLERVDGDADTWRLLRYNA